MGRTFRRNFLRHNGTDINRTLPALKIAISFEGSGAA